MKYCINKWCTNLCSEMKSLGYIWNVTPKSRLIDPRINRLACNSVSVVWISSDLRNSTEIINQNSYGGITPNAVPMEDRVPSGVPPFTYITMFEYPILTGLVPVKGLILTCDLCVSNLHWQLLILRWPLAGVVRRWTSPSRITLNQYCRHYLPLSWWTINT